MIPIVLKVYDGGKLKNSRAFRSERIRLGSSAADLQLDGETVAPAHAVIEAGAHGAVLRALGAAPLYLNGQPIIAAPLRHGDLISIGELRIMVELQKASQPAPAAKARPKLELIQGDEEPAADEPAHHPGLQIVREDQPVLALAADEGINSIEAEPVLELPPPPAAHLAPVHHTPAPVMLAAVAVEREEQPAPAPARPRAAVLPPLPQSAVQGGECAEVELFWGETRVSVWQLFPGESFTAGTADGCDALLQGLEKAPVLTSDVNGWTVRAPRPLSVQLEEGGRTVGGPELLVRGRSQADAQGLVVPLQPRSVAVLQSGSLSLRVRRVNGVSRAGNERTDWKGVLVASIAAVVMMAVMKFWSGTVTPPRSTGEAELIRPRPMIVRTAARVDPAPKKEQTGQQNQGRKDPGKAVARHLGQEGEAGLKSAPRRDARAERKTDDRALVAQAGLLKALGGGKGQNDVFGVALEKGTRDAMGHLTGPRVGDAHGDGGMGLKSLGGHGGGGDGSGLGLARIGTNGIGGGLANYGDGKGGLRGKENGEIGLGPDTPQVTGSIDPELIRKVVHDHRAQIRTCYETQLTSKPDLSGKLLAAWTIDQSGTVTEAHTQESSLHDRTVEACVASKIKTWRFPIPKGGGEVFVTYPFIFTPGG